jgi:hypothetical protein
MVLERTVDATGRISVWRMGQQANLAHPDSVRLVRVRAWAVAVLSQRKAGRKKAEIDKVSAHHADEGSNGHAKMKTIPSTISEQNLQPLRCPRQPLIRQRLTRIWRSRAN